MPTFRDTANRTWSIGLTIGDVKRVRTLLGVDLLALDQGDPPLLARLDLDPMVLADVLYALVKPQADALEPPVSDEAFGHALGGDTILAAHDALMESLADFFRGLGRTYLVTALEKQKTLMIKAMETADQKMQEIDPTKVVEAAMASGKPSTSSPPSPASPTPTP